jgi:hypothetical protein
VCGELGQVFEGPITKVVGSVQEEEATVELAKKLRQAP